MRTVKWTATLVVVVAALIWVAPFGGTELFAQTGDVNKVDSTSKIDRVTVYSDRAMVVRSSQVELKKGLNKIVLKDVPSTFLSGTLRASGTAGFGVKILSVKNRVETTREINDDAVVKLDARLKDLHQKMRDLRDKVTVQNQLDGYYRKIKESTLKKIPVDIETKRTDSDQWLAIINFVAKGMRSVRKELRKLSIDITQKQKEINAAQHERNKAAAGKTDRINYVDVVLESGDAGWITLDISYLMGDASWYPSYDVRLNDVTNSIKLDMFAVIRQRTGEKWENAKITISTAPASITATMPQIRPSKLSWREVEEHVGYGVGAVKGGKAHTGRKADMASPSTVSKPASSGGIAHMATASVLSGYTSTSFEIESRDTVKSDGSENRLPVEGVMFEKENITFNHRATPKLVESAYYFAEMANATDIPFLEGAANLYIGQAYVGRTAVKTTVPGEKFSLSLGIDKKAKITRKRVKKEVEPSRWGKRVVQQWFEIEVENFKNVPVDITILDQIPVSEIKDVVVEFKKGKVKPEEVNEDGVVKWVVNVPAGGKFKIDFSYVVKSPKDMDVKDFE